MSLKDQYYTMSEAAKVARVTRQTIARWIKEDKFPAEKIGRETLIEKKLFQSLIQKTLMSHGHDLIIESLIKAIRENPNVTDEDLIKEIEPANGYARFRITRKNGDSAIVRIPIRGIAVEQEDGHFVLNTRIEIEKEK